MKRLSMFLALGAVVTAAAASPPPPFPMDRNNTSTGADTPWASGSIMDVLDNAKPWPATAVASPETAAAAPVVDVLNAPKEATPSNVVAPVVSVTAPVAAKAPTTSAARPASAPKATAAAHPSTTDVVATVATPQQAPSASFPVGQPLEHVGTTVTPRVPAIQRGAQVTSVSTPISSMTDGMPPPVNLLSNREASLSAREEKAAAMARAWVTGDDPVVRGNDGRVVYRFGGPLPTVVCAPLMVCDVELQAGERVQNLDIGDPRFTVSFALSGSGNAKTVHVRIKPTDTDLVTNLNITTDRRTYVLKLLSRSQDWMPIVAFNYPEDAQAQLIALQVAMAKEEKNTVIPETGQNLNALDFNYKLSGDSPSWRPLRVYTDGKSTYIQFPPQMLNGESPVLVALGDGGQQLVNYRVVGDRYMVDRVLGEAALIVGVGRKQTKVDIRHMGAR